MLYFVVLKLLNFAILTKKNQLKLKLQNMIWLSLS